MVQVRSLASIGLSLDRCARFGLSGTMKAILLHPGLARGSVYGL